MNIRLIILCWFSATTVQAFLHHRSILRFARPTVSSAEEAGDALLLTPLIDAGDLLQARQLALVPPLVDDIRSYAGFLTVDKRTKSHLYFWFVPTTNVASSSAPLILWLQGGPGCSSLFGLFGESGPFDVSADGVVRRRQFAWTNNYHMLYVDQPVGTGFSFTERNGYVSTEKEVAEHLYEALSQFYKLFPEWRKVDFYVAGESYAGKYIPALGRKIHVANQQQPPPTTTTTDWTKIPLKGMMIGNGFVDPENMVSEFADFLRELGLVDDREHLQLGMLQTTVANLIRSERWSEAVDQYHELFGFMESVTNLTNVYDYTSNESPDFEPPFIGFLNRDDVRRIIHAGRSTFDMCSEVVYANFTNVFLQSMRPSVEALLEHYPILLYSGQFDIVVAGVLTTNMIRKLSWSGAADYYLADKEIWRVDDAVAGYYKFASNLAHAMVRNAGHMVPTDQPKNTLALIDMFVQNKLRYRSPSQNIGGVKPPSKRATRVGR